MAPQAEDVLTWSLVVPVKVLALAKSRLTGLTGADRSRLALAMAADTVAAAMQAASVAAVLVVTDDREVADTAAGLGAIVVPDVPAAGLNEAVSYGAGYAGERWPDRGRAGLAGDLPAVRATELTTALTAAAELGVAFVPDADGTGTTLYAAVPGARFRPRFGHGSARRHLADGAAEVQHGGLAGLRRDVDTADDLRKAVALGLGPRTSAVLKCARWG
ncbi:MAG: 2-phospho-L-lactate guanylyltransferase [Actinobacteria bacterium]|nr:2-phospho-L-lactate guanylyltransferase [Actinomycetota bacterium]MBO0835113.1 2-phospho-L-lactate guanylyltransferase [Actinomycetota bacterium]